MISDSEVQSVRVQQESLTEVSQSIPKQQRAKKRKRRCDDAQQQDEIESFTTTLVKRQKLQRPRSKQKVKCQHNGIQFELEMAGCPAGPKLQRYA